MLHRLLHPPSENEDDPEVMLGLPSARTERGSYRYRWWHALVLLVIVFPYISIFVLFGLVSNESETNNYYDQSTITTTYGTSVPSNSGKVVSFTSTGSLQVGAGSSLYNNVLSGLIGSEVCPAFSSMDALSGNRYLLSYAHKSSTGTPSSTLQVLSLSAPNTATVGAVVTVAYNIYSIITLDPAGSFLAVCQDSSDTTETAYLLLGSVTGTVISVSDPVMYAETYSMAPSAIALSSSSFVLGYVNNNPLALTVRYGWLNSTGGIALGVPLEYQDDSSYSYYQTLSKLTESTFMVAFYNSNISAPGGPLQAMIGTVVGTEIELGEVVVDQGTSLSYTISSTTISNNTVAVAFINSLTSDLSVQLLNVINGTVVFGSAVDMNSAVFQSSDGTTPDLDIITISEGVFGVLFTDLSNNNALTLSLAAISSYGAIVLQPAYVLTKPDGFVFGSLAAGNTETFASQTGVFYLINSADCMQKPVSSFNLLHRLSGPAGITTSSSLTVSGALQGTYSTLSPGKVYYANTLGSIVEGELIGRTTEAYIWDTANSAMVSTDGKVGVATASNVLVVDL